MILVASGDGKLLPEATCPVTKAGNWKPTGSRHNYSRKSP